MARNDDDSSRVDDREPADDEQSGRHTVAGEPGGERANGDDTSWTGIAGVLVLVGAVLFLIPEPLTSSLGVLLMVAGVGLWVVDWLT